jgi:MHS family citrate/tricarballylate:H+ symporter-like MFS transporter
MSRGSRASKIGSVIRVSSGNFLEMYDFMVFGYYAVAIGHAFFPAGSAFVSLMLAFMTFGAGFLMRPVGAIVLGTYSDRCGRRAGLLLSLLLMSIGILSIALTPGYSSIGLLAPIIVVLGRLLQGFSAGMELGGVSVYLSEIATPGNKGFYVSWQSASQQVAVIFAAILGWFLTSRLEGRQMFVWGWRIPLLIGCLIVPLLLWLRRSLSESDEFCARKRSQTLGEIFHSLASNISLVVLGIFLFTMTTVSFYTITAYTPTFGSNVLHLAATSSFVVTLCVGISNLLWLPLMGSLSDRVGRMPLLLACTALMALTAYPVMLWLVAAPSFGKLLSAELWYSFLYGSYNAALVVFVTELIPFEIRTVAFSLAYSMATAVFGGFTPAVSTYLLHRLGNRASPGLWLTFAALCGLVAALFARSRFVKSSSSGISGCPLGASSEEAL